MSICFGLVLSCYAGITFYSTMGLQRSSFKNKLKNVIAQTKKSIAIILSIFIEIKYKELFELMTDIL